MDSRTWTDEEPVLNSQNPRGPHRPPKALESAVAACTVHQDVHTSNFVVRGLRRVTAACLLERGCTAEDRVLAGASTSGFKPGQQLQ